MSDEQNKTDRSSAIPGLAAMGLMVTGVAGILHAFGSDDGMGLLAAAVAFGVVFYVSFD